MSRAARCPDCGKDVENGQIYPCLEIDGLVDIAHNPDCALRLEQLARLEREEPTDDA